MKSDPAAFAPRSDILSFSMDDELLLFNPSTQDFILLNSTSAFIWQALCQGSDVGDIIDTLSQAAGLPKARLTADTEKIISQWYALGLSRSHTDSCVPGLSREHEQQGRKGHVRRIGLSDPVKSRFRISLALLNTSFVLTLDDEAVFRDLQAYCRPFACQNSGVPDIRFTLVAGDGHYTLIYEDRPVDGCRGRDRVLPMIHANIMQAVYSRSDCLIGLHAAAVSSAGRTVLMPAPAGSGKSTLVAGMIRSGFHYSADDLVLLDEQPGVIRGVSAPIGIKSGSWPVLETLFPEIKQTAVHRREDGQRIRYLPPGQPFIPSFSEKKTQVVEWIVYPSYQRNGDNRLERISPAQSLVFLSRAGFDLNRNMTPENATDLVSWIRKVPSFTLTFCQLERGISLLKTLVSP